MTLSSEQITDLIADLRARARSAISESATDALNAAADALEAEHQRAEEAEKNRDEFRNAWNGYGFEIIRLEAERDALRAACHEAEFRRDELREAIDQVRALHYETDNTLHTIPAKVCTHRYCVDAAGDQVAWPCPTGRILSRAIDTKEKP